MCAFGRNPIGCRDEAHQIRQPQRLQRTIFSFFSLSLSIYQSHTSTLSFPVGCGFATQCWNRMQKEAHHTAMSVVKFVPALVSVQFCGQTAGSQRKFDEEIARRDNDENGCAGTRFHEGQAEGKEIFFPFACIHFISMCMRPISVSRCAVCQRQIFCTTVTRSN